MIECHICKNTKNLESHHIIPQKDFDENETHKINKHIKRIIILILLLYVQHVMIK